MLNNILRYKQVVGIGILLMWSGYVYFSSYMSFKMPLISATVTLMVTCTCLMLAHWQYERAQDKQQRLDDISQFQAQGNMSLDAINSLPIGLNKTGIKLQLSGYLAPEKFWLLDNRIYQQQVGFDVLAIFYPAQSKQAMLVNLGWIKAPNSRGEVIDYTLPTGLVDLQLQLKEGDLAGFYLEEQGISNAGWPIRTQYIDLENMRQESGASLAEFIGYSEIEQFSLQPHYEPVVMPPEKHIAYAFQWLFIALSALLTFLFALKGMNRREQQA